MKDPEDTRTNLLVTAVRLFARFGYEGVSVRMLAREVGANVAAVGYHFGGKEELYRATCDYVIATLRPAMQPVREKLDRILEQPGFDPVSQASDVEEFVTLFITHLVKDDPSRGGQALLLREYASPGIGFEIFFAGFIEPMHQRITSLYARIHEMEETDPAAVIGAHSLLGQWLCFKLAEQPFLRRMEWDRIGEGESREIARIVVPSVMRSLGIARV